MSDPIADIVINYYRDRVDADGDIGGPRVSEAAKQIRQQIGQELLERRHQLDEFVRLQDIHEVCQLEES